MFAHVSHYAGDPILSLVEKFNQDTRSNKVNLSIGIYFDDAGNLPMPTTVQTAADEQHTSAAGYLPMEGLASFRTATASLLFGANSNVIQDNRVATVQTLGGSGALKLGADFLKRWFGSSKVFVSDPTWDNHRGIFEGAGFEVASYPYYDPDTIGIKFDELCHFLQNLPANSIIVLHPCCHNPTGIDFSHEQWNRILHIIQQQQLIPFMDIAYQGFGDSFDDDAYAIRQAAQMGLSLFVSCSFSKNMSLYAQRIGALAVLCPNADEAQLVLGQLKFGVRRIYSSPPLHGAVIANRVLTTTQMQNVWQTEVYQMRDRIKTMRQQLHAILSQKLPNKNFDYFIKQRGMFSYTGLNPTQVQRLQDEFAVYLLESGRLCVAGLNSGNIDYVASALATVFAD